MQKEYVDKVKILLILLKQLLHRLSMNDVGSTSLCLVGNPQGDY